MVENLVVGPSKVIYRKFREGILNVNKANFLRGRDRLKILANYFLPSFQFSFMAHEITADNLRRMDKLALKYCRKWTLE